MASRLQSLNPFHLFRAGNTVDGVLKRSLSRSVSIPFISFEQGIPQVLGKAIQSITGLNPFHLFRAGNTSRDVFSSLFYSSSLNPFHLFRAGNTL